MSDNDEPIDVPFEFAGGDVPAYEPQPPTDDISLGKKFNLEKLETSRVCVTCGVKKALRNFNAYYGKKNSSPRCKGCSEKIRLRKNKLLADKNARELLKMVTQNVRNAKSRTVPHLADIGGGMIDLFGGIHQFLTKMNTAIDMAVAEGKHKIVQDYYLAIARMCGEAHQNTSDDLSKLSTEELEAIANQMALTAMKNELGFKAEAIPVLAEMSAKADKEAAMGDDGFDDSEIDDINDLGEWTDPALQ